MGWNSKSLLIVDDSATTRRALEILFRQSGWKVATASTLKDGLEQLKLAPSHILLDLMLPDGDGELILQEIRASGLLTRVVVTTGCSNPARLKTVQRLTPHALLHKPLNFTKIMSAMASCPPSSCTDIDN